METDDEALLNAVPGWKLTGLFPRRDDFDEANRPQNGPEAGVSRRFDGEDDDETPLISPPAVQYPPPNCPMDGTVKGVFASVASLGCVDNGDGTSTKITAISGLNTSHTLAWDSGLNRFILSGFGSFTITTYTGGACGGAPLGTDTGDFEAQANCNGGTWDVTVFGRPSGGGSITFFSTSVFKPYGASITNATTEPLVGGGTAVVTRS